MAVFCLNGFVTWGTNLHAACCRLTIFLSCVWEAVDNHLPLYLCCPYSNARDMIVARMLDIVILTAEEYSLSFLLEGISSYTHDQDLYLSLTRTAILKEDIR